MPRPPAPEYLVVGHLTKAHGTRGEVLIRPLTDRPEDVLAAGRRVVVGDAEGELGKSPQDRVVEHSRPYKKGWLAKLEGVADRSAAEELTGRYLLVPAVERPEPEEGEYYYHQLLGLLVVTVEGAEVGPVREVYETEPHHMLEVKGAGRLHLVPFDRRIVRSVELEAGRLVIDPPEGLLEL